MMMRIATSIAIAAVPILAACGSGKRAAESPSPAVADAPCTVPTATKDSLTWKQVRAEGFTFCVPASWRASGAHGWRGEGGSITWELGPYRPPTTVATTRVPAGVMGASDSPPLTHNSTETIDGEKVSLSDIGWQRGTHTTAIWSGRRMYFEGKASGPAGAARQFAIYRTVRFDP